MTSLTSVIEHLPRMALPSLIRHGSYSVIGPFVDHSSKRFDTQISSNTGLLSIGILSTEPS